MSYNGYLDTNDGWCVQGWAHDASQPGAQVEVEIRLSSGHVGTVIAGDFRADLAKNGIGDGRHAFIYDLPAETSGAAEIISAKIKGTNYSLQGSPMPRHPKQIIGLVAGDIVNNCNLRCPFCMVDYANIRGLKLMPKETFEHAQKLFPIMARGSFWLSCLHEPTLHPQFLDYIESVPEKHRRLISFTTNLSRRLPDAVLERLANSGAGGIRVSFDSRQPEVFAELRKGARFQNFEENLLKLAELLRNSRNRPRLHFITMAFRDNYKEIPDLIDYCKNVIGADSHEVRFIYYSPHLAHWSKDHVLTSTEWSVLEESLKPWASRTELTVCGPLAGTREQLEEEQGLKDYVARETAFGGSENTEALGIPDPIEIGGQLPDEPIRLRLRWDGLMMLEQYPDTFFKVNLNKIPDPQRYFEDMRLAAKGAMAGSSR